MSADQHWERALLGYARLAKGAAVAGVLCAAFSPTAIDALVARLVVLRARAERGREQEGGRP